MKKSVTKPVTTTVLVLRYLRDNGPSYSSAIGAVIRNRRGRRVSASGGGDYAAQMLLGRMKKAGLVQHAPSDGSSVWRLTFKGMDRITELDRAKRALESVDFEVNLRRKEVALAEERIACALDEDG